MLSKSIMLYTMLLDMLEDYFIFGNIYATPHLLYPLVYSIY